MSIGANRVEIILDARNTSNPAFRAVNQNLSAMTAIARAALPMVGALTAAASAGFLKMASDAIENADAIGKLSQSIGTSTEFLSAMQVAAELTDISMDGLKRGLKELNTSVASGDSVFAELGITTRATTGELKRVDELLPEIADKFSDMADGAKKTEAAARLFGKAIGPDLIPLLNGGRKAIEDAEEKAKLWGLTVSGPAAAAAEQFNDDLATFQLMAKGAANSIATDLLPAMSELTSATVKFLETAQAKGFDFSKLIVNPDMIKMWAKWYSGSAGGLLSMSRGGSFKGGFAEGWDWMADIWDPKKKLDKGPPTMKFEGPEGERPGADPAQSIESWRVEQEMISATLSEHQKLKHAEDVRFQERIWQIGEVAKFEEEAIQMLSYAQIEHIFMMQKMGEEHAAKMKEATLGTLRASAQIAGDLANVASAFGRKGFKMWKTMAIAEGTVSAILASINAYSSAAKIPYVGHIIAPVVAATALASGMASVAKIAGTEPSGQAHAGLSYVPEESTWMLQRGERVLSPPQNRDLTEFLASIPRMEMGERILSPDQTSAASSFDGRPIQNNVYLDGNLILQYINDASRDGRLEINSRAVVG